jgi:hypothetical protein
MEIFFSIDWLTFLFYQKSAKVLQKSSFQPFRGGSKPFFYHEMYAFHIFLRPVWWKVTGLIPVQELR